MQIAIQAKDGFVLASDIKNRIGGSPASSFMYHSKIAHASKHGIAICVMGYTSDPDAEPGSKLAACLQDCASPSREIILQWAREYVKTRKLDNFSLLIIHPAAQHDRMWKIRIEGENVTESPSFQWFVVHGNENNPAIFWLEYFKCRGECSMYEATSIATLTIRMAERLNTYGVEGLEVWHYTSAWKPIDDTGLHDIAASYERLKMVLDGFPSAARSTSQASSY
jgi:hypothetical protein